jgi:hypothetical protein
MTRLACVVALGVLLGVAEPASAQAIPNLSGTWTQSNGEPLTIAQSGSTLTVTEGGQPRPYNLDGMETKFERVTPRFTESLTAQAHWVSSALVVTITTVSPIGTWQDIEVYSVDYGGKLNRVKVSSAKTQPMMATTTQTYAKTTATARVP